MRKLINNPKHVVREMLEGLSDLNPNLAIFSNENIVFQANLITQKNEVAVISGGGGGHEPAHAGYVGTGMLHAAVSGDVFTSPSADSILATIRASTGAKGALLIVMNYTGDRLNFGLAAELARAEGFLVEMVVVGDDVALRDVVAKERSRGIAGTILVSKVAGALAASGADLASVTAAAQYAAANVATMGVALGSCTIPGVGKPSFELPTGQIELGLGIHGEKGCQRINQISADELCAIMLDKIINELKLSNQDSVAVLINGLGATPPMELAIVVRGTLANLRQRGIKVERAFSGNFMTSLEMPGCSISLLRLNSQLLSALDYPVQTAAWVNAGKIAAQRLIYQAPILLTPENTPNNLPLNPNLKQIGRNIASALEQAETRLTELDSAAGDGDLGLSMCRGANAIRELPDAAWSNEVNMLNSIGEALRKAIAGSSGPFYATGLFRAARYLTTQESVNALSLAEAFVIAVNAVAELGGAKLNDRTMYDALYPAASTFKQALLAGETPARAWHLAVNTAENGAQLTAQMLPKLGRASYLGERALGIPDAGAAAVVVWLKAILI